MPSVRNLGPIPEFRMTGDRKQPFFQNNGSLKEWDARSQFALDRTISVFFRNNFPCILTSAYRDPAKSEQFSLHGFGFAFDVDTDRPLKLQMWSFLKQEIQREVGPDFQVISHDVGSGMHIHVEFDPNDPGWQEYKDELKGQWSALRHTEAA